MARGRIKKAMALAVLGGHVPSERLILDGLNVLVETRKRLELAGLAAGLDRGDTRGYVRTQLSRKRKVHIHLDPRVERRPTGTAKGPPPLVTIVRQSGRKEPYRAIGEAKNALTRMLRNNVDDTVRVVLAIERARRQCYHLSEEATRWL